MNSSVAGAKSGFEDELDLKRQCTSYDINDNGPNIFEQFEEDILEESDESKKGPVDINFTSKHTG